MPSYTGTVTSPHPTDATFSYLAAFEHTAEWDPNCSGARRVTSGELAVGTRFELAFQPAGRFKLKLHYEIVEFDPGRRVRLRGGNALLGSEDTITVEPAGSGSRVTYHAEIGLNGPAKLLDPALGAGFQRAGRDAERGLLERLAQPI